MPKVVICLGTDSKVYGTFPNADEALRWIKEHTNLGHYTNGQTREEWEKNPMNVCENNIFFEDHEILDMIGPKDA